jgi:SecD/SecF fusion protein
MAKRYIDFMGHKNVMFAISGVLLIVSIGALVIQGLNFGIEFEGGTVVDISKTAATETAVREAFVSAGVAEPSVQSVEGGGYIIRFAESDPKVANAAYTEVAKALDLPADGGTITTIGPGWGKLVTNRALLAAGLAIAALLLYISVRFDYKMSVCAVISLVHDGIIVLGIYALSGYEVTPNTIAALLTIMGYSLYDTIVVFGRIKENTASLSKDTFMHMANVSINQVLVRSLNTTITSIIPVLCLLFFGGPTLKDFAFALTIGMISGAYSSIGVASPIYAMWKETEPRYQALKKKYATA